MVSRICIDVIRAFGGKWRGMVFVDEHLVASAKFDTEAEALTFCVNKQSELSREVKDR